MKTLRGQLTIWLAGVLTMIGILGGLAAGYVMRGEQDGLFDDQLRQIALSVGDTPSAAGESYRITAGANPEDCIVIHILGRDGSMIRNSDPDADVPLQQVTGFSDHLDGDITWRIFTLITDKRIIQAAQESEVRADTAMESAINTVLPIILLIPISWLVVGWVVTRLLRPLNHTADELAQTRSAERIKLKEEGVPFEILPLVQSVNGLLERQHELLEFREQFISDAAHQLRTPLTALNLQLQNLGRTLENSTHSDDINVLQSGLTRMANLLNQLLNLARAETPHLGELDRADLGGAVRSALSDVISLAVSRNIDIGLVSDPQCVVRGNSIDVAMMVGNLLDNAVRYTPRGGRVDVDVVVEQKRARLMVRDTGPGIPETSLAHVFDRFYRLAPADSDGSGLGLGIVRALAQKVGAEVRLSNRMDQSGLEAEIAFQIVDADSIKAPAVPPEGSPISATSPKGGDHHGLQPSAHRA